MAADALIDGRAQLQRNLLAWFGIARRDLPWRRRRSLYGTWISEIMLQQTTVAAVVPYWERFLARFPDVGALAAADEQDVLGLWSGLGYYRRARHLHAAARRLQGEAAGRLPTDRVGWAALPGVGAYAAGAIASIGLGERCAALDANARRVITRWAAGDEHELGRLTPARLRDLAESLVPAERPGDWNEAVMELGAIVCRARDPQCASCPVAAQCRAGRAGSADRRGTLGLRGAAQGGAAHVAAGSGAVRGSGRLGPTGPRRLRRVAPGAVGTARHTLVCRPRRSGNVRGAHGNRLERVGRWAAAGTAAPGRDGGPRHHPLPPRDRGLRLGRRPRGGRQRAGRGGGPLGDHGREYTNIENGSQSRCERKAY